MVDSGIMGWVTGRHWGYKPRRPQDIKPMKLPVKNLYLHHTVTPVSADPLADTRRVQQLVYNQYSAIPYNGLVHPDGTILQGRYYGDRPALGAHTLGHNSDGLGLAAIGNYQTNPVTEQLLEGIVRAIRLWVQDGFLSPDYKLIPHRDVFETACCGRYLIDKIGYIYQQINQTTPAISTGVQVNRIFSYETTLSTDSNGNGYVDVYHSQGLDPNIAIAQANGGIGKSGYPAYTPRFWTAAYDNSFVRVTAVGGQPNSSFGVKLLAGWN